MSANGRLTAAELTLVQRGPMNIYLANTAAKAWGALKAEYDRTHPGESLTIAEPAGGYRTLAVQADMHIRPKLYGLSVYSTIPLAKAGFSSHGDGMAVDIADASKASPRKTWLLANASRYGFTRQFGDADPNHYRHDGITAAGGGTRITGRENDMQMFHKTLGTGTTWVVAGPGIWYPIGRQGTANSAAVAFGSSTLLTDDQWDIAQTICLSGATGTSAPVSLAPVLDAIAAIKIPSEPSPGLTAAELAKAVNDDLAARLQS